MDLCWDLYCRGLSSQRINTFLVLYISLNTLILLYDHWSFNPVLDYNVLIYNARVYNIIYKIILITILITIT